MSLGKACLLFIPRKLSQTVNTSDLYVGGFGSNFGQDTDYHDTVSIVVVTSRKFLDFMSNSDTKASSVFLSNSSVILHVCNLNYHQHLCICYK